MLKLQKISKLQIPMTKTFPPFIGCRWVISPVLNFGFRSLGFIWDLKFDAWNFQDSVKTADLLTPGNCRLKYRIPLMLWASR
jgi:hypothetical protein